MSNRLYNAATFNEVVYRPMRLITKPVVVIAGILLAALLLAPTFSVSAQSPTEKTYRYNENRTDPIASFRADRDVTWILSGADADEFEISNSGVLTWDSQPNYETPTDGVDDADGDGTTGVDEGVGNNIYLVNIGANGTVLVEATVKVIDVDDAGKVTLSHLQPAEGVEYEADASDEDDGYRDASNKLFEDFSANNTPDNSGQDTETASNNAAELARWKWEKSQSGTSGWATIADAISHTYTPETADVGYYLRVTVTYSDRDLYDDAIDTDADTDPVANAPIRTARAVSDHPVKAEDNTNQAPVFADDDDDVDDNQQEREVNENDKNALVGAPVRARDSDVLHYSLSGVLAFEDRDADGTLGDAVDPPPGKFKIDKATGQISVNGSLSHEAAAVYTVVVTARDPFNARDTVTVTIDVLDVNDAPKFATGDTAGSTRGWVTENTGANAESPPATGAPLSGDDPSTDATEAFVFTYAATDEDHYDADGDGALADDEVETVSYSLTGPDKSAFVLDLDANPGSAVLQFDPDTKVNFEKQDTYSVTIVARDQRKLTKTRDVTIRVIDAEDSGTIEFSTRQPQVGQPITAEVVDEDGVKGNIAWTWTKFGLTPVDGVVPACPDSDGGYVAIDTDTAETRDSKATFTPLADDVNTGNAGEFVAYCLRVSASYDDGFDTPPARTPDATPEDSAAEAAASPVLPLRRSNSRPVFKEEGKAISSTTREVVEDGDQPRTQMNVENAVAAEDPDDDRTDGPDGTDIDLSDNLTYSLRGEDAASFRIREDSGQIMVKAKLDYETKNTYRVVVRATDGSRAYRDLPVTINITNVNEKPVVSGSAAVTFEENATVSVDTYTAVDPERDAFTWSLKPGNDDDAGKFRIDANTGVLSFKSPPNYEGTGDIDKNNIYEVTVRTTDTVDNRGEKKVEVTVTDVDDTGRIRLSVEQPGEDVLLMATLNDDDKGADKPGAATWQWASGDSAGGTFTDIENATNADYQPDSDDVDMYLRVTASYGSRSNPKTVSKVSAHPVKARDLANPLPVFPDQEPASTETRETDQDRDVPENSSKGTLVGDPVTASDDDVLTYTIFDGHDDVGDGKSDTPSKLFTIDQATGQIKVGSAKLNYEGGAEGQDLYRVTVTATDTSNASEDVKVTIIATDVDEKPTITSPVTGGEGDELAAPETQTIVDADGGVEDTEFTDGVFAATTEAKFTAIDPEGDDVTWSVEGADAGKFKITDGLLAFKSKPDFEAKGSAAGNNRYRVTIVATDVAGNASREDVKVDVTNVNEPGKIKFSTVQPQVKSPLTATLTDPDGVVGKVMWTWTLETPDVADTSPYTKAESVSSTWTPPAGSGDVSVAVCYSDALSGEQACPAGTGTPGSTPRTITQTDNDGDIDDLYEIRAHQPSNSRPAFKNDEGKALSSTTREIEENNDAGEVVGEAVLAEDSSKDTINNNLTYTLGGADAATFSIDRGEPSANGATAVSGSRGQITVKKADALDYETKSVYTVVVTATDGSGASANITVTINVVDVEPEPPKLVEVPPNVEPEFAEATYELEVVEGMATGRNVGAPVAATDEDEDDTLSYELSGDDADSFTITSSGQIRTNAALVEATKDEYTVTVTVDDGNEGTATAEVTIAVTAAPPPVFGEGDSASRSVAENSAAGTNVGDPVTATVSQGDVTYALGGDDAGSFGIDDSTGQITVGEGTSLDFETTASYAVTVTATNDTGGEDSIDVAISVENVNEPGTLTLSTTNPAFGVEISATLEDPDGGITGESWEWQWSEIGAVWHGIPGGRSASYTPTHADGGLLLRAVVEYTDAAGESSAESAATGLPPAPTPPAPEPTPTPVPPAPTPTPVPPAPTPTPVPPTATPVPPTATPVPPTATSVPPAPTATPVPPEDEGGFPGLLVVIIVLGLAAVVVAGVLIVRNRQQR